MRRIRDPDMSGHGRLQDYRVDMLAANGSAIPVQLSASLVLDGSETIGSRRHLHPTSANACASRPSSRAPKRSSRNREKQAIVAELAGPPRTS